METVMILMKDIQVQPWWQYEDDITMFNEHSLINKKSFEEVDSQTLTPQHVVATRWVKYTVNTQQPTNTGQKDIKCRCCGKDFLNNSSTTGTQTLAATPSSMAMQLLVVLLLTAAILKHFTVFTTDVASAFLNTRSYTPIDNEVLVPPKEYYYNNPHILWRLKKHSMVYAHHQNNGKNT
eukprot:4317399-Amphidinium_carterae.3